MQAVQKGVYENIHVDEVDQAPVNNRLSSLVAAVFRLAALLHITEKRRTTSCGDVPPFQRKLSVILSTTRVRLFRGRRTRETSGKSSYTWGIRRNLCWSSGLLTRCRRPSEPCLD